MKNREASVSAITLKENFYDFDLAMIEIKLVYTVHHINLRNLKINKN